MAKQPPPQHGGPPPREPARTPAVSPPPEPAPLDPSRRSVLRQLLTVLAGGVGLFGALAAAVAVFLDPLRRRSGDSAGKVKVAMLENLPLEIPQRFSVLADRVDAWNYFPLARVGEVYLLRTAGGEVLALNAKCPHAGCPVPFDTATGYYECPCHNSSFDKSGKIHNEKSPSPRGLDALEVEQRKTDKGTEVWVRFQNFQGGTAEKKPIT